MSGRRITKTKERRIADLQVAIRRSGFSQLEVVQHLADWYGWTATIRLPSEREITIRPDLFKKPEL